MLPRYDDILRRIPEPPLWWHYGVPRYEPFSPSLMGSAREAALVDSRCQSCSHNFIVGIGWPDCYFRRESLSDQIENHETIWLPDPPNVGCCSIGYSETSIAVRVIQFWQEEPTRPFLDRWHRKPEYEKELPAF